MMKRVASIIGLVLILPKIAAACPSCYGAAKSPMIDGMNMAILGMLGVTGIVLFGVSSFFFMVMKRARVLREQAPEHPSVNDKGVIQWNNS